MANEKVWLTAKLFYEWFKKHFCQEVKKYCEANNLSYKALLIIDNAPGHIILDKTDKNIKILFLPPNTTCLIQPMGQGDIATFKKYYLRRSFKNLIDAIDNHSQTKEAVDVVRTFGKNMTSCKWCIS